MNLSIQPGRYLMRKFRDHALLSKRRFASKKRADLVMSMLS
jgi:hypothetical protein